MKWLDPASAEKVLATSSLLIFTLAGLWWCRTISGRWGPGSLTVLLFGTLTQVLFLGFYNWLLACGAAMLLTGLQWKRLSRIRPLTAVSLSAGWLAVCYIHTFAYAVFAVIIVSIMAGQWLDGKELDGRSGGRTAVWTLATLMPGFFYYLIVTRAMPTDGFLFTSPSGMLQDLVRSESLTFWTWAPDLRAAAWCSLMALAVSSAVLARRSGEDPHQGPGSPSWGFAWLAPAAALFIIGVAGPAGTLTLDYAPDGWLNGNRRTFGLNSRVLALLPVMLAPWIESRVFILRKTLCVLLAAACVYHAAYAFEPFADHDRNMREVRQITRQIPPHSLVGMTIADPDKSGTSGYRRADPMTQPFFYAAFDSEDTVIYGNIRYPFPSVFPIHAYKRQQTPRFTHLAGWDIPAGAGPAGYREVVRAGRASLYERIGGTLD